MIYRDYDLPREKFKKLSINHNVNSVHHEVNKGDTASFLGFDDLGEVRMFVDFDAIQTGDSFVKPKNTFDLKLYRDEEIIFNDTKSDIILKLEN